MDLSTFKQHNLLYTQESLSRYQPGGYHPVTLGDTFKDDRYKVHHKLGWGGFSTVWLAEDTEENTWVALKILTASSNESRELRNLRILQQHSEGRLSSHYIVQLLDSFSHEGPNGVHQCLVFELLGPSVERVLMDYTEVDEELLPEIIIRMSTQFLKALKFIHNAGMCHGDISGANLAFTCAISMRTRKKQLLEAIGAPKVEPLARKDGSPLPKGLPTQLVEAAESIDWIDEYEEDVRILDVGESFLQGEEPEKLAQPGILQAPETILTDKFDYRVDLWRAGCTIYLFLFGSYPFFYMSGTEELVYQMINFVEGLPAEWQWKWQSMKAASKLKLEAQNDDGLTELEKKFAEKIHDPSLQPLLSVIQGLMRFLPSNRISVEKALELLEHTCATGLL